MRSAQPESPEDALDAAYRRGRDHAYGDLDPVLEHIEAEAREAKDFLALQVCGRIRDHIYTLNSFEAR